MPLPIDQLASALASSPAIAAALTATAPAATATAAASPAAFYRAMDPHHMLSILRRLRLFREIHGLHAHVALTVVNRAAVYVLPPGAPVVAHVSKAAQPMLLHDGHYHHLKKKSANANSKTNSPSIATSLHTSAARPEELVFLIVRGSVDICVDIHAVNNNSSAATPSSQPLCRLGPGDTCGSFVEDSIFSPEFPPVFSRVCSDAPVLAIGFPIRLLSTASGGLSHITWCHEAWKQYFSENKDGTDLDRQSLNIVAGILAPQMRMLAPTRAEQRTLIQHCRLRTCKKGELICDTESSSKIEARKWYYVCSGSCHVTVYPEMGLDYTEEAHLYTPEMLHAGKHFGVWASTDRGAVFAVSEDDDDTVLLTVDELYADAVLQPLILRQHLQSHAFLNFVERCLGTSGDIAVNMDVTRRLQKKSSFSSSSSSSSASSSSSSSSSRRKRQRRRMVSAKLANLHLHHDWDSLYVIGEAIPGVREFPAELRKHLLESDGCKILQFQGGRNYKPIWSQGEHAGCAFFILQGCITVRHKAGKNEHLGPGEMVGGAALTGFPRRHCTIECTVARPDGMPHPSLTHLHDHVHTHVTVLSISVPAYHAVKHAMLSQVASGAANYSGMHHVTRSKNRLRGRRKAQAHALITEYHEDANESSHNRDIANRHRHHLPHFVPHSVLHMLTTTDDGMLHGECKQLEKARLANRWAQSLPQVVDFLKQLPFFTQFLAGDELVPPDQSILQAFALSCRYRRVPAYTLLILENSKDIDQSLQSQLVFPEELDSVFVVISGTVNIFKSVHDELCAEEEVGDESHPDHSSNHEHPMACIRSQSEINNDTANANDDVGDNNNNIDSSNIIFARLGVLVNVVSSGDCIGELHIMQKKPRSATAVTRDTVEVLIFEPNRFRSIVEKAQVKLVAQPEACKSILQKGFLERSSEDIDLLMTLAESSAFLNQFSLEERRTMCRYLKLRIVPADRELFRQGDEGSRFYIVINGKADVHINPNVQKVESKEKLGGMGHSALADIGPTVATLGAGDSFGEQALMEQGSLRNATIVSSKHSTTLELAFLELPAFLSLIRHNNRIKTLNFQEAKQKRMEREAKAQIEAYRESIRTALHGNIPFFEHWTGPLRDRLAAHTTLVRVTQSHTDLARQGAPASHIFVLVSGIFERSADEKDPETGQSRRLPPAILRGMGKVIGDFELLTDRKTYLFSLTAMGGPGINLTSDGGSSSEPSVCLKIEAKVVREILRSRETNPPCAGFLQGNENGVGLSPRGETVFGGGSRLTHLLTERYDVFKRLFKVWGKLSSHARSVLYENCSLHDVKKGHYIVPPSVTTLSKIALNGLSRKRQRDMTAAAQGNVALGVVVEGMAQVFMTIKVARNGKATNEGESAKTPTSTKKTKTNMKKKRKEGKKKERFSAAEPVAVLSRRARANVKRETYRRVHLGDHRSDATAAAAAAAAEPQLKTKVLSSSSSRKFKKMKVPIGSVARLSVLPQIGKAKKNKQDHAASSDPGSSQHLMQVLATHDCQLMFTHYNGGVARGATTHGSELGHGDLKQLQQLQHSIHEFFGLRADECVAESAAIVKKPVAVGALPGAAGAKLSKLPISETAAKAKASATRIAEKAAREAKSHFLLGAVPLNPNRMPIPPRLPRSQHDAEMAAPLKSGSHRTLVHRTPTTLSSTTLSSSSPTRPPVVEALGSTSTSSPPRTTATTAATTTIGTTTSSDVASNLRTISPESHRQSVPRLVLPAPPSAASGTFRSLPLSALHGPNRPLTYRSTFASSGTATPVFDLGAAYMRSIPSRQRRRRARSPRYGSSAVLPPPPAEQKFAHLAFLNEIHESVYRCNGPLFRDIHEDWRKYGAWNHQSKTLGGLRSCGIKDHRKHKKTYMPFYSVSRAHNYPAARIGGARRKTTKNAKSNQSTEQEMRDIEDARQAEEKLALLRNSAPNASNGSVYRSRVGKMGKLRLRSSRAERINSELFVREPPRTVAPDAISEDMILAKNLEIEAMLSGDLSKPFDLIQRNRVLLLRR